MKCNGEECIIIKQMFMDSKENRVPLALQSLSINHAPD